jgi:dipeptidyl aminopeptidase/acylaminoacyl peptidase
MLRRLPLFLLLVFVVACDSAVDEPRVVAGVDLDALFAPPTQAERAAILADWQARTPVAESYELIRSQPADSIAGVAYVAQTYRYVLDGLTLYGLALVPQGGAPASSPVVAYNHGGDGGVSLGEVELFAGLLTQQTPIVWIAPSFRDEPLIVDGSGTLRSDGPASPWDRDVDDALALLSAVVESTPVADASRIGAMGLSRGGGVALLMSLRDDRIARVLDFFGPTDFFSPFVSDIVADALGGADNNLPGFDVLNARFVQPLREGTFSAEQMRLELLRRSPAAFADRLPLVQVQHGTADDIVPVDQSERLERALRGAGRSIAVDRTGVSAEGEFFYWQGGGHNPLTFPINWIVEAQRWVATL